MATEYQAQYEKATGREYSSANENTAHEQARLELGPDASLSSVLQRAAVIAAERRNAPVAK